MLPKTIQHITYSLIPHQTQLIHDSQVYEMLVPGLPSAAVVLPGWLLVHLPSFPWLTGGRWSLVLGWLSVGSFLFEAGWYFCHVRRQCVGKHRVTLDIACPNCQAFLQDNSLSFNLAVCLWAMPKIYKNPVIYGCYQNMLEYNIHCFNYYQVFHFHH